MLYNLQMKFQTIYKTILVVALFANLTFFFPLWGWPTTLTIVGAVLSFCYAIVFVMRIRQMPRSAAKYYLIFLFILFIISYFGLAVTGGLAYYRHATDPMIALDDFASFDWLIPLIFQMAHIVVFAVIVLSEAFLARSPKAFLVVGSVLFGLWAFSWFVYNPFGFFNHIFLVASLLVFVIALFRPKKPVVIETSMQTETNGK